MLTAPRVEIAIGSDTDGLGLGDVGIAVAAAGDAVATEIEAGVGLAVDVHPPTMKVSAMTTRRARDAPGCCIT